MSYSIQEILSYTSSIRLLYVEDNEDTRRFTLELLSRFFKDISVAIHGKEGLELFKNESYDLILSDITMPIMDGLEMSAKIREIDKTVPIIILSAHNETHYTESASNINITEYLEKPLDISELINTLNKIIRIQEERILL
ncbi:MAG: YesN/AraC family two-component response regulator [Sulfurimonas sp.]|jgi:YesN/AraC family two-component response regulator|uniref:response regulator n=1 Tax=Sulfurimonas sp. TaxID=2022749 RepID=UPI0039E5B9CD